LYFSSRNNDIREAKEESHWKGKVPSLPQNSIETDHLSALDTAKRKGGNARLYLKDTTERG
jgi:hypothetical protein